MPATPTLSSRRRHQRLPAAPRSWAERAYPKLIHTNKLDKGTHFTASAQPELFVWEMLASFTSLR